MIMDLNKVQMDELTGQLELDDVLPKEEEEAESAEGYDAEGNLMDYAPEAMPADAANRLKTIAVEINTITEQARGVVISAALAIGRRLIEAKAIVPRGRFGEWLAANVPYSERKAQDMMRLYEQYGRDDVPEAVARLDYSKAVALLAAPEEAREALAERASAEGLSVRQLQDEIENLKRERAEAQLRITDLESRASGAEDSLAEADERAREQRDALHEMSERLERAKGKADAAKASADILRKARDEAQAAAEASAERAGDAVRRANETQEKLLAAEARLRELEARPPEVKVVEQAPAIARFRLSFERLAQEFRAAEALLKEVYAESQEEGARYAAALKKACERMIGRIEGNAE